MASESGEGGVGEELPRLELGRLAGRRVVGRGHYAVVYTGWLELPDGQRVQVAMKKLITKPFSLSLCPLEEALVLQELEGVAGVPRLYGVTASQPHILVMSFCHGLSLMEWRCRGEVRRCLAALLHVCTILSRMHARRVSHGDLHSCNILVEATGSRGEDVIVWVVDFGLARREADGVDMETDVRQLLALTIGILGDACKSSRINTSVRDQLSELLVKEATLVEIALLVCGALHEHSPPVTSPCPPP